MRIEPGPRHRDGRFAEIRGEDLNRRGGRFVAKRLDHTDCDRVRFLPGGATGNPDPNRPAGLSAFQHLGEDGLGEDGEELGVTEEAGDADEQIPVQCIDFGRIRSEHLGVLGECIDVAEGHAPQDPPLYRADLVLREVHARASPNEFEDRSERVTFPRRRRPVVRPIKA